MNLDFIKELGIEAEDNEEILAGLQVFLDDYLDQVEYVDDEDERADIEGKIKTIKEQIDLVKKIIEENEASSNDEETQKPKSVLIAVEEETKKNIPIAVSEKELRKEEEKDEKKKAKRDEDHIKQLQAEADKLKKENAASKKADDKSLKDKIQDDKKAAAASTAASSTSSTDTSNSSSTSSNGATNATGDIAKGLIEYANKNFNEAYNLLNVAVNDSKNSKDPQIGYAEFVLAEMYKHGQGSAPKDEQRAEFWYDKSASHKNPHAAFELGINWGNRTPGSVAEADEIIVKSLKYFEMAVDNSAMDPNLINVYKNSMDRYIMVCEQKTVANSHIKKACDYIDKLASLENDAYLKEQLKKRKTALKSSKSSSTVKSSGTARLVAFNGINDIGILVSILLFIVGAMAVSRGILFYDSQSGLKSFWTFQSIASWADPGDSAFIDFLMKMSDFVGQIFRRGNYCIPDFLNCAGHRGLFIMCIATVIATLTDRIDQGRITMYVSNVLSFVPAAIVGMGLMTKLFNWHEYSRYDVWMMDIVAAAVFALLFMCVGVIIGKIIIFVKYMFT